MYIAHLSISMQKFSTIIFIVLFICSCSTGKYATTNKSYKKQAKAFAKTIRQAPLKDSFNTSSQWVGTTNFGMRKPNFVIIHHTAQNACDTTLRTFTLKRTQVSAHYVICESGTVYHMLNDYLRAWHAGNSRWGNLTDVNSSSIGIELDNDGFEPFTDAQINSLISLLGNLKRAHGIPAANFIGHADIAPTRKNDPNINFPWKKLADNGFGLWWGDTTNLKVATSFDHLQALRIVGYDMRDTSAAIQAFRRHFITVDGKGPLSKPELKVLASLVKKYM